jgi:hypothetical protein
MANIKTVKGSELPIVEDINKATFLAYEEKDGILVSGRIDFKSMIPLFAVSQEKGQSTTQVPSQKAWTDDSNNLHSEVALKADQTQVDAINDSLNELLQMTFGLGIRGIFDITIPTSSSELYMYTQFLGDFKSGDVIHIKTSINPFTNNSPNSRRVIINGYDSSGTKTQLNIQIYIASLSYTYEKDIALSADFVRLEVLTGTYLTDKTLSQEIAFNVFLSHNGSPVTYSSYSSLQDTSFSQKAYIWYSEPFYISLSKLLGINPDAIKALDITKTANIYNYLTDTYIGYLNPNSAIVSVGNQSIARHTRVKVERGQTYTLYHTASNIWMYASSFGNNGYMNRSGQILNLTGGTPATFLFSDADFDANRKGHVFTVPASFELNGEAYTGDVYFVTNVNVYSSTFPNTEAIRECTIEKGNISSGYLPYYKVASLVYEFTNSKFAGKTVAIGGDSNSDGGNEWTSIFAQRTHCLLNNRAVGGSNSSSLVQQLTEFKDRTGGLVVIPSDVVDYTNVAATVIMVGTNDDTALGSIADIPTGRVWDNEADYINYFTSFPNTYYGNIALCIEYIQWKNPATVIYLITPLKTRLRTTIENKANAIKELGKYYSVKVIDASNECGINLKNETVMYRDGLHTNDAYGIPALGNYLTDKILSL